MPRRELRKPPGRRQTGSKLTKQIEVATNRRGQQKTLTFTQKQQSKSKTVSYRQFTCSSTHNFISALLSAKHAKAEEKKLEVTLTLLLKQKKTHSPLRTQTLGI